MPEKILYIIRHAQPDYPGGVKRCLGRKCDLPLSAEGRETARALAARFAALPVEAVYASPLLRAQQTAAPIAGCGRPLVTLPALIELDGGAWDGMPLAEIRARFPQGMGRSVPPGGETDESGLSRMMDALSQIDARTKRCAVLVAHGGVNRLLLCALHGAPLAEKKRFAQAHGGVGVIVKEGGVWRTAAEPFGMDSVF